MEEEIEIIDGIKTLVGKEQIYSLTLEQIDLQIAALQIQISELESKKILFE